MIRKSGGSALRVGGFIVACGLLMGATGAYAASGEELQFILNTFSFLIWGVLVMWMCAGFTMLEAGSVRTKNASMICLKNIGLYSIAGITYYLVGYNLMYVDVQEGWIGSLKFLYGPSGDELKLFVRSDSGRSRRGKGWQGHHVGLVFSDGLCGDDGFYCIGYAGRKGKAVGVFCFTAVLTTIIYPIVGAWTWGGGWLSAMGFQDFAGSTIVHSTGGWAALAGALVVGARHGKFRADGSVKATPPSNVPAVTLGVFILWLGWFGFNGGSQLALSSAIDAVAMSHVLVNTNLAAAAGVIAALFLSRPILGRIDLLAVLNGALAGLVSITAGPDIVDHYWALVIGAVGSVLCVGGMKVLEILKIDDIVGAIPVHLFAGIWGTLAVCIAAGGNFGVQLIGILAVGAFSFAASWISWLILGKIMGVRVSQTVEELGQDTAELGIEAYPEFVLMPDQDDVDVVQGNS